jgi:drug/metabolite transporter (DMT)-like permease
MLFAVLFLKEKVTPARVAAVASVLVGAVLMRF